MNENTAWKEFPELKLNVFASKQQNMHGKILLQNFGFDWLLKQLWKITTKANKKTGEETAHYKKSSGEQ